MYEFLQKHTITIAELEANADKIVTKASRSGQPFLITKDGKPMAMLLDIETFFNDLAAERLAREIAVGEADIAAGKVQDLDEVLREISRVRKVSRSRRQSRQG
jgi:prevent-host-death family protein